LFITIVIKDPNDLYLYNVIAISCIGHFCVSKIFGNNHRAV
jgi:hypothetical protein